MNAKEFLTALDFIVKEKGLSKEFVLESMEAALNAAYKRNFNSLTNSRTAINPETGEIKVHSFVTVVGIKEEPEYDEEDEELEESAESKEEKETEDNLESEEDEEPVDPHYVYEDDFNPEIHITLEEARKIVPGIEIGETIETEVTPADFGRVAASTAKQVMVQRIKEAEKQSIVEEFSSKQDELMLGELSREDEKNYYVDLGRTSGVLPKSEIIPGEKLVMGSQVKVYVSKVEIGPKGPFILLSRAHFGFVKRLLEMEIPELSDGTVILYGVAREAGVRSKIAVYTEYDNIEPLGAVIGANGTRIGRILKELNGEKIDVILYDKKPDVFIANALSPAKNVTVIITNIKNKEAVAILDDANFSLAIGKKGQNVKLASRLTHYKIDIKKVNEVDFNELKRDNNEENTTS